VLRTPGIDACHCLAYVPETSPFDDPRPLVAFKSDARPELEMDTNIQRALHDKLYDKRKTGALEYVSKPVCFLHSAWGPGCEDVDVKYSP
jgi:hypothetical protein